MQSTLGCILMVVITFPISFLVARSCLRGLIRFLHGNQNRDVL